MNVSVGTTIKLIKSDFHSWCRWKSKTPNIKSFFAYFSMVENRYIIGRRLQDSGGGGKLLSRIIRIGTNYINLYIWTKNIGPGMTIMHGFSTVINARSIGNDFHCSQQVTIGWGKGGEPIIGDNVKVYAGAIVIGNIHIGNNVIIGAGAVVNKDVPDNTLVVNERNRYINKKEYDKQNSTCNCVLSSSVSSDS